jgi:predicted enzyme related to lactoylglutathione lyase
MTDNHQNQKRNWSHWFEIPATDFQRAIHFYETIFQISIEQIDFGSFQMGILPHEESGGAVVFGEWYKPGQQGTLIYMNANPDLNDVLNRIETSGGQILQPKKKISPEHGFMALFIDSEGNRMALHSSK